MVEIQVIEDVAYMLSWELSLIKVKVVVNVRSDAKEVVQGLG